MKWKNKTPKETQDAADRALIELMRQTYAREFKIVEELKNGQVLCKRRDDGSLIILNDWRK